MYQSFGNIHLYGFINDVALVLAFVLNLFILGYEEKKLGRCSEFFISSLTKNKKSEPKLIRLVFIVCEVYIISFAQFYLGELNGFFGELVGTGANYYGTLFVSPIMVAFFGLLLGRDIFKLMDLITLTYPLKLIFVKLACFCQGCCKGFACSYGLYNHSTDQIEFPVQLVEMALAAIIFVFLMLWRKKAKEGTMYPLYLIIYSATRFFSEFLRQEENVLFILKKYHILCLVGIAVGILLLFVVRKYKDRINRFYEEYFDAAEDTLNEIAVRAGIKRENEIVHRKNKKRTKYIPVQDRDKKARISNMKKWIIIWTLGLIGQIGWNVEGTWFNTFVYEKIDKTPSIITPMLIMSAFATTVSIFLFGTLTDRTGKRRTLVSSGFVVWGILISCFGLTQYIAKSNLLFAVVSIVFLDMLLSFFGSMSTDVGYSTWLTDIMNDSNRGQIGGAIAVQVVLGQLLGTVIGGYLVGSENNYIRLFIVIGTLLSFFGMISVFLFDKKDDAKPSVNGSFSKQLASVFNFRNLLKNKELLWVNVAVAIFFVGFNIYYPHLGNFLTQYLGYSAEQMGIIEAVPLVLAMLITMPVSKYINRNKFIEVVSLSVVVGLAGNLMMFSVTPEAVDTEKTFNMTIFTGILLVGISYVVMLQATKTWTKNLHPKETKGQYEGLWAIAYAFIPMLFGSNISEWLVKNSGESLFNEITERYEYIPNGKLFFVGAIISTFSIIPIIITKKYIKEKALKAEKEKQL